MLVAAYCRVSTEKEDQVSSFESQKRFFREYIEKRPGWELYGIYADEGITGTSTKKRKEFNRMITDAESGRFGLIVTKEVSRFARNTLDALKHTRELKRLGIGVLFLNDNINTLDSDAELRLTIMSSIAQEESRKTSERVKWGQRRRMEQGVVFGRDMLGYDVRGGKLYVNREGAQTVRLIYRKFLEEGKGTTAIARELQQEGLETARHGKNWTPAVVLRVLRNEKYCGDLVQKKTYTPDYLSHRKKCNRGEEDFIVLRDHHEPIVSRETFERAQMELKNRSPAPQNRKRQSVRYCFSGRIVCGCCGSRFVARTKSRKDKSRYRAWRCYEAALHGPSGCAVGRQVPDEALREALRQVVRDLSPDRERLAGALCGTVRAVLSEEAPSGEEREILRRRAEELSEKRDRLVDLYAGKKITEEEYRRLAGKYAEKQKTLEEEIHGAQVPRPSPEDREKRLSAVLDTVRALACGDEWDDVFYRGVLDSIVVYSYRRIDIFLRHLPFPWPFALPKSSADGTGQD